MKHDFIEVIMIFIILAIVIAAIYLKIETHNEAQLDLNTDDYYLANGWKYADANRGNYRIRMLYKADPNTEVSINIEDWPDHTDANCLAKIARKGITYRDGTDEYTLAPDGWIKSKSEKANDD